MASKIAVFATSPSFELLYRSVLEAHGYGVTTHQATVVEVMCMEVLQPDLILWGHMTGLYRDEWWFLDLLRHQPSTAHIPVVISTTGYQRVHDQLKAVQRKNVILLQKPFGMRQLLDAIVTGLTLGKWLIPPKIDAES